MQILIVDDEGLARDRMRRLIDELPDSEVVGEAVNGKDALAKVEQLDPELVLMDIRMPELDGLEAARQLANYDDPPAIVFCTAYDEYALEAFGTLAASYLVKPVQLEDLQAAIEKAKKLTKLHRSAVDQRFNDSLQEQRQHISARTRKGLELIALESIHCFIADHKYVTVYHGDGETLIDETLKDLESEFPSAFIRVHRNALVAIKQISAMEKDGAGHYQLRLKSSEYCPSVSRRHLAGVRELLSRL